MKKEDLIIKWLDNSLNDDELKAFEQLDASRSLKRIDEAAKQFKAPHFDIDTNFQSLLEAKKASLKAPNTTSTSWKRMIINIAAAVVIGCVAFYFIGNKSQVDYLAQNTEQTEFTLPDHSHVILNSGSKISFNKKNWDENRNLRLSGEAYFKVAKGEKFTVETKQGDVSVLGTQFKVNTRENYFEISTYEGLVQVNRLGEIIMIPAGSSIKFINSEKGIFGDAEGHEPSWLHSKSNFKSVSFEFVLKELERQYDISIEAPTSIYKTTYTGSFTHENLETALEAITIPLNLSFEINDKNVTLK